MSELPDTWSVASLKDISVISYGQSPPSATYNGSGKGFPFFQGKAEFTEKYAKVQKWCTACTKIAEPDDILLSIRAPVGPTNLAPVKCGIGRGLAAIRASLINQDYLRYFFKFLEPKLSTQGTGTTFKAITKSVVDAIRISIAPLNEQKRIVEKIEELFSQIDAGEAALKKAQALIKQYRQSLLRAAVTGELTKEWREKNAKKFEPADKLLARIHIERRARFKRRGKYDEPLPSCPPDNITIPKNWVLASIDQISSLVQYGSSAKCGGDTKGIAVLRMGNLGFGQIDLTKLKYLPKQHDEFPALILDDGDLLFNRTNSAELVGKTAVYSSKMGKASFASYLIRVKFLFVEPQYVAYFINSTYGRQWVSKVVSQQVGQANVNGTKLRALTIPLPPLEEQRAIIDAVEERFTSIDHLLGELEHKALLSSSLRQSILKAAFSGQLVPQDPNDEPASVLLERIKAEREDGEASRKKRKAKTNAVPKSRKRAAA